MDLFLLCRKNYNGCTQELKFFKMYVNEKSALLRGSLYSSLSMRILSAKNLRFSLEKPNVDENLAFKDLNLNVNGDRQINCHWYQKSTYTGLILTFRSCAPLQHNFDSIDCT